MIPFVITFYKFELVEYFGNHYFGQVENLTYIDDILFKDIVLKLIDSYMHKLTFNEVITWSNFCSCVNSNSYDTSIFFSIKYFDPILYEWNNYDIDDSILETNFIKILSSQIDNKKIFYSIEYTNQIEKTNKKKIIRYKNNSAPKSDFIVEF